MAADLRLYLTRASWLCLLVIGLLLVLYYTPVTLPLGDRGASGTLWVERALRLSEHTCLVTAWEAPPDTVLLVGYQRLEEVGSRALCPDQYGILRVNAVTDKTVTTHGVRVPALSTWRLGPSVACFLVGLAALLLRARLRFVYRIIGGPSFWLLLMLSSGLLFLLAEPAFWDVGILSSSDDDVLLEAVETGMSFRQLFESVGEHVAVSTRVGYALMESGAGRQWGYYAHVLLMAHAVLAAVIGVVLARFTGSFVLACATTAFLSSSIALSSGVLGQFVVVIHHSLAIAIMITVLALLEYARTGSPRTLTLLAALATASIFLTTIGVLIVPVILVYWLAVRAYVRDTDPEARVPGMFLIPLAGIFAAATASAASLLLPASVAIGVWLRRSRLSLRSAVTSITRPDRSIVALALGLTIAYLVVVLLGVLVLGNAVPGSTEHNPPGGLSQQARLQTILTYGFLPWIPQGAGLATGDYTPVPEIIAGFREYWIGALILMMFVLSLECATNQDPRTVVLARFGVASLLLALVYAALAISGRQGLLPWFLFRYNVYPVVFVTLATISVLEVGARRLGGVRGKAWRGGWAIALLLAASANNVMLLRQGSQVSRRDRLERQEWVHSMGGPEAEVVARVGDIDNLGFGWPSIYGPFLGRFSSHAWPWVSRADDVEGTDQIVIPSSYDPDRAVVADEYSPHAEGVARALKLQWSANTEIREAWLQIQLDDIDAYRYSTQIEARLDGKRLRALTAVLRALDLAGGRRGLVTSRIPARLPSSLSDGEAIVEIDDPESGIGDAFAIDFVRILLNPTAEGPRGNLEIHALDDDTGELLEGVQIRANVTLARGTSGPDGMLTFGDLPTGLVLLEASLPGYNDEIQIVEVDLAGQSRANFYMDATWR